MKGSVPSKAMLDAAAERNRIGAQEARAKRAALLEPSPNVVPLLETTRAQVRRLSGLWDPRDWAAAMQTACRAHQRCTNPRASSYPYYGGRGVRFGFPSTALMADWLLRNLGPRPEGMTLDRINTNGHYAPGNLRWATVSEQMANRNSWRHGT